MTVISDEQFDNILAKLVAENVETLLSIPGIYEVLSEHFNNEVLELFEQEQGDD